MSELLTIEQVKVDADLQAREALNADTVTAYAAHLIEGGDLPPIVVFREGVFGEIWLGDGFHRRAAYVQAGRLAIPADVRKGSRRDAFLYALGANEEHGLRRTNADRRRAVTLALSDPELGKLGNRAIGKICKVSHPFVGTVRAALSKPESSLDEIDLWEGERDPDVQLQRILDCYDVAECEALLGAAGCVVRDRLETSNHRQELRKIARAKLHADVAALFSLRVPGRREAALRRSQELALYETGATGAEFDTLAKPAEWAKALQFKNLSKLDRMIGLIAQVLKVDSWGDVNNKPLLEALPDGCAFKGWITAQCEKKAAEWVKQKEKEKTNPPPAWPAPKFGSPEQAEQEAQLLAWVKLADPESLRDLWLWGRSRWMGYQQHAYTPWDAVQVTAAARDALLRSGVVVRDCANPKCDGFTSPALVFTTQKSSDQKGFCWICQQRHDHNADRNTSAIDLVSALLRRGWVTLAELGIEAAPVVAAAPDLETLPPAPVEAAPVVEAAQVETLPPADVEAAPVEAAPSYRVGWGKGADVAKRLCGMLLNIARSPDPHLAIFGGQQGFVFPYLQELRDVYAEWNDKRIVPSPLVRWVPVFDVAGDFVNGPGWLDDLLNAINSVAPRTTSAAAPVTPPAVSDTDHDPIPFNDRDLWELAPLARVAFKKLLAYTEKLRIEDFNVAQEAAQVWQAAGESVPQGMPIEVQAVIEALANPANTEEQVADLLHVAHFAGKVAIRWINNAEEDEPVKTTSPTGRAMQAIKDAEIGAAAK